ncbi:unnamed protein product [Mytilus edulis]|uniref:Uncharacterized protein n=1 Tax=Mytilus edulis TaxID=6550 RepID=A0A8S3SPA8_MYTED|nr:unnamed protein product [Mytilus edulis]
MAQAAPSNCEICIDGPVTEVYLRVDKHCQQWEKNVKEMETIADELLLQRLQKLKIDVDDTDLKQVPERRCVGIIRRRHCRQDKIAPCLSEDSEIYDDLKACRYCELVFANIRGFEAHIQQGCENRSVIAPPMAGEDKVDALNGLPVTVCCEGAIYYLCERQT